MEKKKFSEMSNQERLEYGYTRRSDTGEWHVCSPSCHCWMSDKEQQDASDKYWDGLSSEDARGD